MHSSANNQGVHERAMVSADSVPFFPAHVKLHHDEMRDRWVLLAPERLLEPDEVALDTLKLCDGHTAVKLVARKLSEEYNAVEAQIMEDIIAMLQDLVDKGFVCI